MAQLRPGFFLGGEARYLRRYEGIGLEEFAGQALFVGPTAYFQLSRAHAADRGLEHAGMGAPGRVECGARSRQLRTPSGAADIRRQFLRRGDRHEAIREPGFQAFVKPSHCQMRSCSWYPFTNELRDVRHECDRPDRNGMCRAVAGHLRRAASGVFLGCFAAAMRHGCAALYRAMGGRASEMDRGQVALRIPARQRQGDNGRRRR